MLTAQMDQYISGNALEYYVRVNLLYEKKNQANKSSIHITKKSSLYFKKFLCPPGKVKMQWIKQCRKFSSFVSLSLLRFFFSEINAYFFFRRKIIKIILETV